ncbi:hypothetical protein ABG768_019066 [Culter alburnus]|uniref:Uncharacterized protein n=1 Tax=Culter alburnus TaxID=194366 RepID=A0AAW2AX76_CULAL
MDSLESNNTVHLHTVRFLWGVSVNFIVDLFQQVLQISRIGGRNTIYICGQLFTNSLMAKFNLKGKGKRGKRPLEGTKVYRAIKEGIMRFDSAVTEEYIKMNVAEHLKHAPQRLGGGGFSTP